MIAEAISYIRKLTDEASSATGKVAVVTLPDNTFLVVDNEGCHDTPKPLPQSRTIELDGVIEFSKVLIDFKARHEATPTIWYDTDGVVAVVKDAPNSLMNWTAVQSFEKTKQHASLLQPTSANHRQFLRLIRTLWWDCFDDNSVRDDLVKTLQKLDFTNSTKSEVSAGRANYGMSQTVNADGHDLTRFQELSLSIRLYTDPSLETRHQVTCLLDIDLEKQTFCIIPLGDALQRATQADMQQVQSLLEASGFPAFQGRPGHENE